MLSGTFAASTVATVRDSGEMIPVALRCGDVLRCRDELRDTAVFVEDERCASWLDIDIGVGVLTNVNPVSDDDSDGDKGLSIPERCFSRAALIFSIA